jgi:hypothetical protein
VAEAAPEERVEQVDSGGWLLPGLLFGGFNLLLLGAALAWYLVRRRRAVVGPDDGLEDLLGDADGEVAANPGQPEETPREAAA